MHIRNISFEVRSEIHLQMIFWGFEKFFSPLPGVKRNSLVFFKSPSIQAQHFSRTDWALRAQSLTSSYRKHIAKVHFFIFVTLAEEAAATVIQRRYWFILLGTVILHLFFTIPHLILYFFRFFIHFFIHRYYREMHLRLPWQWFVRHLPSLDRRDRVTIGCISYLDHLLSLILILLDSLFFVFNFAMSLYFTVVFGVNFILIWLSFFLIAEGIWFRELAIWRHSWSLKMPSRGQKVCDFSFSFVFNLGIFLSQNVTQLNCL